MPKEIKNPIRDGLPSKIYLLAYSERISGYALAKKIYGEPTTSPIYRIANNQYPELFSYKKEKGYLSEVEPLLEDLKKRLENQDKKLAFFEEKMVKQLLGSEEFRSLLGNTFSDKMWKESQNASRTILDFLGGIAVTNFSQVKFRGYKTPTPKTLEEFKRQIDNLRSSFETKKLKEMLDEEKGKIPILKKFKLNERSLSNFQKFLFVSGLLRSLPLDLFKAIASLSPYCQALDVDIEDLEKMIEGHKALLEGVYSADSSE